MDPLLPDRGAPEGGHGAPIYRTAQLIANQVETAVKILAVVEAIAEFRQVQFAMGFDGVSARGGLDRVVPFADGFSILIDPIMSGTGCQSGLAEREGG